MLSAEASSDELELHEGRFTTVSIWCYLPFPRERPSFSGVRTDGDWVGHAAHYYERERDSVASTSWDGPVWRALERVVGNMWDNDYQPEEWASPYGEGTFIPSTLPHVPFAVELRRTVVDGERLDMPLLCAGAQ